VADAFTFKDMVRRWHDEHLLPIARLPMQPRHYGLSRFSLPSWQALPAKSLTSAEASERFYLLGQRAGPGAARHAFRYAHAAFAWAENASWYWITRFEKLSRLQRERTAIGPSPTRSSAQSGAPPVALVILFRPCFVR
jgi:hypothetical protein